MNNLFETFQHLTAVEREQLRVASLCAALKVQENELAKVRPAPLYTTYNEAAHRMAMAQARPCIDPCM